MENDIPVKHTRVNATVIIVLDYPYLKTRFKQWKAKNYIIIYWVVVSKMAHDMEPNIVGRGISYQYKQFVRY